MIYLASSWKNEFHDGLVQVLRAANLNVFNYRETNALFHWREVDICWEYWDTDLYLKGLKSPIAQKAFENDMDGLIHSDTLVLLEPSGISAHLELGYAIGRGMRTYILHQPEVRPQPELMSKMAMIQTDSVMDLLKWLGVKD